MAETYNGGTTIAVMAKAKKTAYICSCTQTPTLTTNASKLHPSIAASVVLTCCDLRRICSEFTLDCKTSNERFYCLLTATVELRGIYKDDATIAEEQHLQTFDKYFMN